MPFIKVRFARSERVLICRLGQVGQTVIDDGKPGRARIWSKKAKITPPSKGGVGGISPRRRDLFSEQGQYLGRNAVAFFDVGEAGEDELAEAQLPVVEKDI